MSATTSWVRAATDRALNALGQIKPGEWLQAAVAATAIGATGYFAILPIREQQRKEETEQRLIAQTLAITMLPVLVDMDQQAAQAVVAFKARSYNGTSAFIKMDGDATDMLVKLPSVIEHSIWQYRTLDPKLAVTALKLVAAIQTQRRAFDRQYEHLHSRPEAGSAGPMVNEAALNPSEIRRTLRHLIAQLEQHDVPYTPPPVQ